MNILDIFVSTILRDCNQVRIDHDKQIDCGPTDSVEKINEPIPSGTYV
ncbi:MAG TPA: hypothetical protein VGB11_08060 [Candidatus Bathyarchaeia archaeon]